MRKYIGELIGSFFIVFAGVGSLLGINFMVSAMGMMLPYGFSTFLSAAAFGTTTSVMYYVFNRVTGGHFNPAVTLAVFIEDGVKKVKDLILYIVSQVIGSILAICLISFITAQTKNLGQVGFGEISPLYIGVIPAVIVEFLLTIFVVLVFLTARDKKLKGAATEGGAAVVIGTSVFSAYTFGILATGGGLNPAKIFASAIVAKGTALSQLPIFFFVPLVAGVVAFLIFKGFVKASDKISEEANTVIDVQSAEKTEETNTQSDTKEINEESDKDSLEKADTSKSRDEDKTAVEIDKISIDAPSSKADEKTDMSSNSNEEIQAMLDEEILATTKDEK